MALRGFLWRCEGASPGGPPFSSSGPTDMLNVPNGRGSAASIRDGCAPCGILAAKTVPMPSSSPARGSGNVHLPAGPFRGWSFIALLLVALGQHQFPTVAQAQVLTPESPEVRAAVQRGVRYLSEYQRHESTGRLILSALAIAKSGEPMNHPKIQQALQRIANVYGGENLPRPFYESVYETSVAIILLAAVDPQGHRREIQVLVDYLLRMQRPSGTFSNPPMRVNHGDTSMTQYAVLAFWEAEKAGASVPIERWQAAANWLLKTQKSNGGFVYNPEINDDAAITPSMSAGGLGTCYIIAARTGLAKQAERQRSPNAPSVLKPVEEKQDRQGDNRLNINTAALNNALNRGDNWFAQNGTVQVRTRQYYYLYSFERYRSFREYVEGHSPPAPHWYDQAARFLLETEDPEKAWGNDVFTAFAVLFLVRSTRQGLAEASAATGSGTLIGGRGLPLDVPELEMKSGKIVVKPLSGPAEELLNVMGNPNDERFSQAVAGLEQYAEQADDKQLSPLVVRLRQLAQADDPAARAAAIRTLSKARNLDDVPLLIHALRDEDDRVSMAARDSLRYVSRRIEGFGLRFPASAVDKDAAARKWSAWYLSIRPGAELEP